MNMKMSHDIRFPTPAKRCCAKDHDRFDSGVAADEIDQFRRKCHARAIWAHVTSLFG
jgi:hypothetical protein